MTADIYRSLGAHPMAANTLHHIAMGYPFTILPYVPRVHMGRDGIDHIHYGGVDIYPKFIDAGMVVPIYMTGRKDMVAEFLFEWMRSCPNLDTVIGQAVIDIMLALVTARDGRIGTDEVYDFILSALSIEDGSPKSVLVAYIIHIAYTGYIPYRDMMVG